MSYFPDSEFVDQAEAIIDRMFGKLAHKVYGTGEWYFGRRAFDSELIYFEDVVENYPGTESAPEALLRQYEIHTILEYDEERAEVRERLLRAYPDSDAARDVQGDTA